jgi:large subunit ribosomal protein L13
MNIDATNLIVGRIATIAAKQSLLGKDVNIINCEKAVITGNKKRVLADYKRKREMGTPAKGPFIHRSADKIVKRIIRGMLPYKQEKGRIAFKKIKCYTGNPEDIKDAKTIKEADVSRVPNLKYIKIGEISKFLGSK